MSFMPSSPTVGTVGQMLERSAEASASPVSRPGSDVIAGRQHDVDDDRHVTGKHVA